MSINYKVQARQIVHSVQAEIKYFLEFLKSSDDWEAIV